MGVLNEKRCKKIRSRFSYQHCYKFNTRQQIQGAVPAKQNPKKQHKNAENIIEKPIKNNTYNTILKKPHPQRFSFSTNEN
jgi:hypothetical protein